MSAQWHVSRGGQQSGPHSAEEVRDMLQTGQLSPDEHVWQDGMGDWKPVRQVSEFADAIPAAPAAATVLSYDGGGGGGVTPQTIEILRQTQPWVRFMGIILFIMAGILLVTGVFFLVAGEFVDMPMGWLLGVLYAGMAVFHLVPGLFLNRYASNIAALRRNPGVTALEQALLPQKSFWKFVGISTLVLIAVYFVVIAIAMVAGASV